MSIEVFNRYEKKYLLDEKDFDFILNHIKDYMIMDQYNKEHEFYNIANIYYDTINDDLISKSIEKPDYKEKLRLRSYGVPTLEDKVFLEIKKKYNGIVNKRRTKIVLKDAYDFVEKDIDPESQSYMNLQVKDEIKYMLKNKILLPKLYLTYDRKAFFDADDWDFRVTFDTNIKSRRDNVRLEAGSEGKLLINNEKWLMEIKSSKAIPLWFTRLLSERKIYPSSFSKYGTEYRQYMTAKKSEGDNNLCLDQYLVQRQLHQYQPGKQLLA